MSSCGGLKCVRSINEKEKYVVCDGCKEKFHYACTPLSSSELRVIELKGKRSLKYFCNDCEESLKCIPTLRSQIEVLEDKFDALMNKIDNVLNGATPQQSSSSPASSDAEIMNEVFERQKRMNNIMIFNYGPITDQPEITQVSQLLSNVTAQQINVSKVTRVGKPNKNGHKALKVTLNNASDIGLILKNKGKAIREKQVYMETDMTPIQRNELHTARAELNERKVRGEDNFQIKYVNGQPKVVAKN